MLLKANRYIKIKTIYFVKIELDNYKRGKR